jgi:hypothetical protein
VAEVPPKGQPRWVEIADFRPGIITQAQFGYGLGGVTTPVPWIGPPGAAQPSGTVGCVALPNGGLTPLPGITKSIQSGFTPSGGATAFINGCDIHALGPIEGDEIVYGVEAKAATSRQFRLNSYIDQAGIISAIKILGPSTDTSDAGISPLTGGMTRVNPWQAPTLSSGLTAATPITALPVTALVDAVAAGDVIQVGTGPTQLAVVASAAAGISATSIPIISATPTFAIASGAKVVDVTALATPGSPCLALSYTFIEDSGAVSYNWLYPDPGNPGSFSLFTFVPSYNSLCMTHQNRVVELTTDNYEWVGTVGGISTLAQSNETFNYSDPPNSELMGAQQEVFVAEVPTGIGAWGSIQSGEAFYVKNGGGAFIISGDFNNPIVTYLGGVTPTYGALNSKAAQTVVGLVYAANGNGVWAWQGGSSADKISNNLNDDFWTLGTENPIDFCAASWGDWVVMTAGWLFDSANGGWWKLADPGFVPLYYGPAGNGFGVWAVANSFLASTDPIIALYSDSTPGETFTWKSYPLKETIDTVVEIQAVSLRAQGVGNVTITLEGPNGSSFETLPVTVPVDSTQPVLVRLGCAAQAQDVTISIESVGAGGNPAPTIYSVAVCYVETTPVNQIG